MDSTCIIMYVEVCDVFYESAGINRLLKTYFLLRWTVLLMTFSLLGIGCFHVHYQQTWIWKTDFYSQLQYLPLQQWPLADFWKSCGMHLIIDETVLLLGNCVKFIYYERLYMGNTCLLCTERCMLLEGVLYHVFKQMTIYRIIKPTDNRSEELEICPWCNRFHGFEVIRTSSFMGIRNCLIVFNAFRRAN